MSSEHFDQAAAQWDENPTRIALSRDLAKAILQEADPAADWRVLDFGCGTGLVGLALLDQVGEVTGADTSDGMLEVLRRKIADHGLTRMHAVHMDLQQDDPPEAEWHMIVTAMVMHHVEDIDATLRAFYRMLKPGGVLCVADLDLQPGTFHGPDGEVPHEGFQRADFQARVSGAGFDLKRPITACEVEKPDEQGTLRRYTIFLTTARRPAD
jgi:ubiquinone/menaquinone biosynthesis C-methylase UbiE